MSKYILLNYATGMFFEAHTKAHIEAEIGKEIADGEDLEDLKLFLGKEAEILKEMPIVVACYKVGPWKSNLP